MAQLLCLRFLTDSIVSKRVQMNCLVLSWRPESCQFHIKSSILYIHHWSFVFRSTFLYLQPLFVTHVLIVEAIILILFIWCLDLLYLTFVWT